MWIAATNCRHPGGFRPPPKSLLDRFLRAVPTKRFQIRTDPTAPVGPGTRGWLAGRLQKHFEIMGLRQLRLSCTNLINPDLSVLSAPETPSLTEPELILDGVYDLYGDQSVLVPIVGHLGTVDPAMMEHYRHGLEVGLPIWIFDFPELIQIDFPVRILQHLDCLRSDIQRHITSEMPFELEPEFSEIIFSPKPFLGVEITLGMRTPTIPIIPEKMWFQQPILALHKRWHRQESGAYVNSSDLRMEMQGVRIGEITFPSNKMVLQDVVEEMWVQVGPEMNLVPTLKLLFGDQILPLEWRNQNVEVYCLKEYMPMDLQIQRQMILEARLWAQIRLQMSNWTLELEGSVIFPLEKNTFLTMVAGRIHTDYGVSLEIKNRIPLGHLVSDLEARWAEMEIAEPRFELPIRITGRIPNLRLLEVESIVEKCAHQGVRFEGLEAGEGVRVEWDAPQLVNV